MVERGHTIIDLVASRCGVAIVPESLQTLPHTGVAFRLLAETPVADFFLAWRANSSNPALRAFREITLPPARRSRQSRQPASDQV
jgi:DNA-binding transcriptional LysR family regulator